MLGYIPGPVARKIALISGIKLSYPCIPLSAVPVGITYNEIEDTSIVWKKVIKL